MDCSDIKNQSKLNDQPDFPMNTEFKCKYDTETVNPSMYLSSKEMDINSSDYHENVLSLEEDVIVKSEGNYDTIEGMDVKEEIRYEDVAEIDNSNINLKIEEIEIKTDQQEFESFQDVPTSPLIIKNENLINHKYHTRMNCQGLSTRVRCFENLDETRHAYNYKQIATNDRGKSHKDKSRLENGPESGLKKSSHVKPSVATYKCANCSYVAKYKSTLKNHLIIQHSLSVATMYKCEDCSYVTKHKNNLRIHLLSHRSPSEVTMHKCDSCSYETKHKGSLKNHLLIHRSLSDVTMYQCENCSYRTKQKRSLKCHMLIHRNSSDVTMYRCESCLFATKYKYNLNTHLLLHRRSSGTTIYKCENCSYATENKVYLKKHSRVHLSSSEVTIYKCEHCLYATIRKSGLRRHLLVYKNPSDLTTYRCESCSFITRYKCSLKTHSLIH